MAELVLKKPRMTVAELIAELQKLPQDLEVLVGAGWVLGEPEIFLDTGASENSVWIVAAEH